MIISIEIATFIYAMVCANYFKKNILMSLKQPSGVLIINFKLNHYTISE
jgi:hypothetical protein